VKSKWRLSLLHFAFRCNLPFGEAVVCRDFHGFQNNPCGVVCQSAVLNASSLCEIAYSSERDRRRCRDVHPISSCNFWSATSSLYRERTNAVTASDIESYGWRERDTTYGLSTSHKRSTSTIIVPYWWFHFEPLFVRRSNTLRSTLSGIRSTR
jgi:hypothetical protein